MRKEAVERSYVDFEELLEAIAPAETEAVFEYEELHDALCSIHLAQCAPWHREPWDGRIDVASPQAHNPIDFAQLANWICSTVAYLRHEFEKAMA